MVRPDTTPTGPRTTIPAPRIQIPAPPTAHITRTHLFTTPTPRVTLVSAPPGYGKTTALADWASRQPHLAWLTLDHTDNQPHTLWSAVTTALGATLAPPRDHTTTHEFLAHLNTFIDTRPHTTHLVLDDTHHLTNPVAHTALDHLIRLQPRKLHLTLCGRTDPPIALARLRAHGQLREIRTTDLAFTDTETTALLAQHSVTLTDTELGQLLHRTEGWPTGIRLTALDDTRGLADYLTTEVLQPLPPELHDFLISTSTCDRFTQDLAETLTGRTDTATLIERLLRTHLIRRSHDPGWYRHHRLLRAHLRTHHTAATRDLHRTAAHWHAKHNHPLTALRHAIASTDEDLTAELLTQHGVPLVGTGDAPALRTIAHQLPAPAHRRPAIGLPLALAELVIGDVAAAELRLDSMDHTTLDERQHLLRAVIELHHARLTNHERLLDTVEALTTTQPDDPDLRLLLHLNRGTAHFWLGDNTAARTDLNQAYNTATALHRHFSTLRTLTLLASLASAEGDFGRLTDLTTRTLTFAQDQGWKDHPATSAAHTLAAFAAYQTLDNTHARHHATRAVALLGTNPEPAISLAAHALTAVIDFDRGGDAHQALVDLRTTWNQLHPHTPLHPSLIAYLTTAETRMALLLGRPDWATRAEHRAHTLLGDTAEQPLLRAFHHFHHRRTTAALNALRTITKDRRPHTVTNTLIYAHLLTAQLTERPGPHLHTALELAETRTALRPFLDTNPATHTLLATHTGRFGRLDTFATHVLDHLPTTVHTGPPLSPRELELLAELPSLRTLGEIAASHYVSVNTVKTHLRSLYRKLGVTSRRDAIHAARARGLL